MGATFATQMGDSSSASTYTAKAKVLEGLLANHWDGSFLFESTNRKLDSAVIIALNDGYNDDGYMAPTNAKVAATVSKFNKGFCSYYTVNQNDNTNGIPGILYGRYQGDSYAGGNPWILNTAALAMLFYRGSQYAKQNPSSVSSEDLTAW